MIPHINQKLLAGGCFDECLVERVRLESGYRSYPAGGEAFGFGEIE